MFAAARSAGMPLVEAYKYRFAPIAARARALVETGAIGSPERVVAQSGFVAPDRSGRLFDPLLAGGAIFDIGGYPMSLAIGVARWAGVDGAASILSADGDLGSTGGRDGTRSPAHRPHRSRAHRLDRQRPCAARHGVRQPRLARPVGIWGDRTRSGSAIMLRRPGHEPVRIDAPVVDPFAAEADAVAAALHEGRTEVSEMTWAESRDIAEALASWHSRVTGSAVS